MGRLPPFNLFSPPLGRSPRGPDERPSETNRGIDDSIVRKARELTAEHKKIMQEFNLLQDELDGINLDEAERLNIIIN